MNAKEFRVQGGSSDGSWASLRELATSLISAVVIGLLLNIFVLQVTEVQMISMEGTLVPGERLLINKLRAFAPPARGEIVVFDPSVKFGDLPYIKRVVAVAGDTVDLRDGRLYVNGVLADYPEAHGATDGQNPAIAYPLTVPEGEFLAMGDNRVQSADSRSFGPQSLEAVRGTAILRFWPIDRWRWFGW